MEKIKTDKYKCPKCGGKEFETWEVNDLGETWFGCVNCKYDNITASVNEIEAKVKAMGFDNAEKINKSESVREYIKEYDGYGNNIVNVVDTSTKDLIITELFVTLRASNTRENVKEWCMEKINEMLGDDE